MNACDTKFNFRNKNIITSALPRIFCVAVRDSLALNAKNFLRQNLLRKRLDEVSRSERDTSLHSTYSKSKGDREKKLGQ